MKHLLWALVFVATPAIATPTYLSCNFPSRDATFEIQLTVDESSATVSTFMPRTGKSERLPATFTPSSVIFSSRMMSYELSRVDLNIVRTVPSISSVDHGSCKLVKAPARAF